MKVSQANFPFHLWVNVHIPAESQQMDSGRKMYSYAKNRFKSRLFIQKPWIDGFKATFSESTMVPFLDCEYVFWLMSPFLTSDLRIRFWLDNPFLNLSIFDRCIYFLTYESIFAWSTHFPTYPFIIFESIFCLRINFLVYLSAFSLWM